jgi:hypothetical protein
MAHAVEPADPWAPTGLARPCSALAEGAAALGAHGRAGRVPRQQAAGPPSPSQRWREQAAEAQGGDAQQGAAARAREAFDQYQGSLQPLFVFDSAPPQLFVSHTGRVSTEPPSPVDGPRPGSRQVPLSPAAFAVVAGHAAAASAARAGSPPRSPAGPQQQLAGRAPAPGAPAGGASGRGSPECRTPGRAGLSRQGTRRATASEGLPPWGEGSEGGEAGLLPGGLPSPDASPQHSRRQGRSPDSPGHPHASASSPTRPAARVSRPSRRQETEVHLYRWVLRPPGRPGESLAGRPGVISPVIAHVYRMGSQNNLPSTQGCWGPKKGMGPA